MPTVHYYVWKDEEGEVIGWYACEGEYTNPTAIEVSKEDYIRLGGNPDTVMAREPPNPENPIDALQKENKLLKAQIQAQSSQLDFLEDCIAEMAMQVYRE